MEACPHCGEPVPPAAAACPHCGSDAETGWNPDAEYLGLELPEGGYAGSSGGGDAAGYESGSDGLSAGYWGDAERAATFGGAGRGSGGRLATAAGYALVAVAAAVFFAATNALERPEGLLLFVVVCLSFFVAETRARSAIRRRMY